MKKSDYYFESEWVKRLETQVHWRSYWLQQKLIEDNVNEHSEILEIGVGTGFCSNYLKSKGFVVTTVDIDKNKNPDIVANICLDEIDYSYDVLLAFEVFEHLPFECFKDVFSKLKKSKVNTIIMSIPERKVSLFSLKISFLKRKICFKIDIPIKKLPSFLKKRYKLCRAHNWELNFDDKYSHEKIIDIFNQNQFHLQDLVKSDFNNHVFFVLKRERGNK